MGRALGKYIHHFLHELGAMALFFHQIARAFLYTEGNFKPIMQQIAYVSIRSLPTVAFAGVFVGAILVLQFNQILAEYDAQSFLGGLNTSSVVREVGPLIISFLLAGKIGAYTAAELGTMRVTEQIDAIQCLGTNPIQYLIVPRFIGIVISSVILLLIGLLISIGGAMVVANTLCGINFLQFATSIPRFTDGWTLAGGLFKSSVYGTIVAGVACHQGYTASGGARGVGKAVTLAAVYTNFYIVIANFVTSHIVDTVSEIGRAWMGGGS
ncbi:ABC transporter permease [Bdellovibrionota bacterium FG-1]